MSEIQFILDDKQITVDFSEKLYSPTTTLLKYLRSLKDHKGVKEGCGEGDCGACTVVVAEEINGKLMYKAIDSCLVFLPWVHGKQVITVEGLGTSANLHPVQKAMVDMDGSQCGFCTPGFVMSIFAIYKSYKKPNEDVIRDALAGNLCRCTGYRPIIDAAKEACKLRKPDQFSESEKKVVRILKGIKKQGSVKLLLETHKYWMPETAEEAISIRRKNKKALLVSGATDVALRVTKKHENIPEIIDLSFIDSIKEIVTKDGYIHIGAGLSLEMLRQEIRNDLPALSDMLDVFGSKQIRSKASLGGNIGSASPIGDTLPVLMAYDAIINLQGVKGIRSVRLREFIKGYRTIDMKSDEIIAFVSVPVPDKKVIYKSYKISKRTDLDISTVSACFSLKLKKNIVEEFSAFYGGMAAQTSNAAKASKYLLNKEWNLENIEHAAKLIDQDFSPISDARSGAEARKIMARNLLLKFFNNVHEKQ
ncbi:MAG: xanthine dehydrogenase small subunit [Marinilabiliales bacterium]|nr:MAG: xanthine dehydrogenase small subunit [Marinilabiliales bacterium]